MISLDLDVSQFKHALSAYAKTTRKDGAEIINKRAKNIILICYNRTNLVAATLIAAELASGGLAYKIVNAKRSREMGGPKSGRWTAATQDEINDKVKKLVNARKRSAGYNRVAVMMAGKAFGLFGSVKTPKGWASESKGIKAPETESSEMCEAVLKIVAPHADLIIGPALQHALDQDAHDMLEHVREKMQKTAAKYSAK